MIQDFMKSLVLFFIPKIGLAIGFTSVIIIPMNTLSTEEYSKLSLIVSLSLLISLFPTTWFGQSNLKLSKTRADFFSVSILFLIVTLLVSFTTALVANNGIWVASIAFLNAVALYTNLYLQSKGKVKTFSYLEGFRGLSIFVIFYCYSLISTDENAYTFSLCLILSYFSSTLVFLFLFYKDFSSNFDRKKLERSLISCTKYGGYLSLWIVFYMSISYMDRLRITTIEESFLGLYDLIFRVIPFICSPVLMLVLNKALRDKKYSNKREVIKLVRLSGVFFFAVFMCLMLITTALIEFDLLIWLGGIDKYMFETHYIYLALLSSFGWQVAMLAQKFAEKSGQTRLMALTMLGIMSIYFFVSLFITELDYLFYLNLVLSLVYALIVLRKTV